jgi:uncharacterized protein with PIN domain
MPTVSIRFYEELNQFLAPARRKQPFRVEFPSGCTAKAVIENLGVPHTEVDLLLANGESVDFSYRLRDEDRLSVYPVFESWDIGTLSRVRSAPLRDTRFSLDVHLGKLARLLRMFGFDAAWSRAAEDEELARMARQQARIILTRDRGLLKRRLVTHGYLVRATEPRDQATEVIRRFDLTGAVRLFGRCMRCNEPLVAMDRREAEPVVPAVVARLYAEFSRCPGCGRVFWKGSHWERMKKLAAEVLDEHGGSGDGQR